MADATITGLNLYPIKSCRGIPLEGATLGPTGFTGDRRWMVVTEAGRFLTQRQLPRLALIGPQLGPPGLSLTAPRMPDLSVAEPEGPPHEVTVQSDRCSALDAGAEAAAWLSTFLEEPVRLVRFDPRGSRITNPAWGGATEPIEFPDGFPLLVVSEASLEDLNRRLAEPLPMTRFRPNIVLSGLDPYGEDRIDQLTNGELRIRMVWPCARCKVTTVDQHSGTVSGPEPLVTLRGYRYSPDVPGVLFGQYAVIADSGGGELHLGDRLTITWK